jgi:hypothetical protein
LSNPITTIAGLSPGVATAAVQSNLSNSEKQQLAAFTELKKTHDFLTTLPQNDAYKSFSNLTPEWQSALRSYFSPKYVQEDRGFFGNIGRSLSSSADYAVQTFKELGMQIAGLPITPTTSVNPAEAILTLATGTPVAVNKETGVASGAGRVLESLVRPQEKLVKQPYTAQKLAEEEGVDSWSNYGRFLLEGAKELLPGGRDAQSTDNATNFMKYWEQAADKENVYDNSEVAKIDTMFTPDVQAVGKLLASRMDIVDAFDSYSDNPAIVSLIARYTSGDEEANKLIGEAVARYSKAKISPGRDITRSLVELFPHAAERAILGDGAAAKFFDTISGSIDLTVTFGLDPLIRGGKAKRSLDAARFGLIKLGVDSTDLQKAWQRGDVQGYWNRVGKLLDDFRSDDFQKSGAALDRKSVV